MWEENFKIGWHWEGGRTHWRETLTFRSEPLLTCDRSCVLSCSTRSGMMLGGKTGREMSLIVTPVDVNVFQLGSASND